MVMMGDHGEGSRSQWTTVKVMVDVQDEKAQSAEYRVDTMDGPTIRVSRNKSVCLQSPGGKGILL